MNTRSLVISGLSLAILAGCGGPVTANYRLTFDTQDVGEVEVLTKATVRVAQRRLDRLGAELFGQHMVQDAEGANLELTISTSAGAKALEEELAAPFDLNIMAVTDDAATADVTVEGFGSFKKTAVNGDDIQMVTAKPNADGKGASVQIKLTEDGLGEMRELFKQNIGKSLGLFVRGKLVSALTVASSDVPNPLVIDGIPDAELASIFADDVNVGLHVTVTPL